MTMGRDGPSAYLLPLVRRKLAENARLSTPTKREVATGSIRIGWKPLSATQFDAILASRSGWLADQRDVGPGEDLLEDVWCRCEVQSGEAGGVHVGVLAEISAGTELDATAFEDSCSWIVR